MKHIKAIASVAIIATMVAIIALNAYVKYNEKNKENSSATVDDLSIEGKANNEETEINMSYVDFGDVKDLLSGDELLAAKLQGKLVKQNEKTESFHGYELAVLDAYFTDNREELDMENFVGKQFYEENNIEYTIFVVHILLSKNMEDDSDFCVGNIRPYSFDKEGNEIAWYELGQYVNNTQEGKSSWMQYLDIGEERECILAYAVPKADLSKADKMIIQINPFGIDFSGRVMEEIKCIPIEIKYL